MGLQEWHVPLAPDDVQQHQRRPGRPLRTAFELPSIARRRFQVMGGDGPAKARVLRHSSDIFAMQRLERWLRRLAKVPQGDLRMRRRVDHTDALRVGGGVEQCRGQLAGLRRRRRLLPPATHHRRVPGRPGVPPLQAAQPRSPAASATRRGRCRRAQSWQDCRGIPPGSLHRVKSAADAYLMTLAGTTRPGARRTSSARSMAG